MTENPWVIGAIAGIPGGIIAMLLLHMIVTRAWAEETSGRLEYGAWVAAIGVGCLLWVAFGAWALAFDPQVQKQPSEFWSAIVLVVGMGTAATYCLGEFLGVKGNYDQVGIAIRSPWTGRKTASWGELRSVDLNRRLGSYTLVFKDGGKIRLSVGLKGISGLVNTLAQLGFDVEPLS